MKLARRTGIWLAVLPLILSSPRLHAQNEIRTMSAADLWPLEFLVAPYGGLPIVSGAPDQALGVHVVWPWGAPWSLAGRYELRWTSGGQFYDAGSADLVRRLVGNDATAILATGGWARWDRRDYSSVGLRATWPFIPPAEGGAASVQGWFDVRYASLTAGEALRLEGRMWVELMLVLAFRAWVGR